MTQNTKIKDLESGELASEIRAVHGVSKEQAQKLEDLYLKYHTDENESVHAVVDRLDIDESIQVLEGGK